MNALAGLVDLVVVPEVCAHLEVLGDGHRREDAPILGNDRHAAPDPVCGRPVGDVVALQRDSPTPRPYEAERRLERRGLARGISSQQAHDLALGHIDRDPLEDPDLAVVRRDVVEPEQRRHFVVAAPFPR